MNSSSSIVDKIEFEFLLVCHWVRLDWVNGLVIIFSTGCKYQIHFNALDITIISKRISNNRE